jgi:hypothetical protein
MGTWLAAASGAVSLMGLFVALVQRWLRWLEGRGGIEEHPMVAVLAALFWALMGRPAWREIRWVPASAGGAARRAWTPAGLAVEAWIALRAPDRRPAVTEASPGLFTRRYARESETTGSGSAIVR